MLTVLSSWIDFLARDTQVPTEIMRRGSDGQAVLAETAGEVCDFGPEPAAMVASSFPAQGPDTAGIDVRFHLKQGTGLATGVPPPWGGQEGAT